MSKSLKALETLKQNYKDTPHLLDEGLFKIVKEALNDNYFYEHMISKICEYLNLDIKSHRDLVETENEILNALYKREETIKQLKTIIKFNSVSCYGMNDKDSLYWLFKIIKEHRLLNYVLKNPKCASMYHLKDYEIEFLKGLIYEKE